MTRRLLAAARLRRTWGTALLVLGCLLGGLWLGDENATGAARAPEAMARVLHQRLVAVQEVRRQATAADQAAEGARRLTARAAIAALLAGADDPEALLPKGMRFACLHRAAGQCVVVTGNGERRVSMVWPAYRPAWARNAGLPPGACDGQPAAPAAGPGSLSGCEREWLRLWMLGSGS